MKFNDKKCCMMHFGYNNPKAEYTINDQRLASSSSQRDLGIMISDQGTPGLQCALAAKKANQVLGQISRSFTCYKKEIMLNIYKVFVRPHLEYAVPAWAPWHKKDAEALEKVQHRATRRMSNVRGTYEERLRQLNLTTLEERRTRGRGRPTFF